MQFVIHAHDGENMLETRMRVRQRHLENITRLNEEGRVICAGGILDSEGKLCGSVLVMDFDDRAGVDAYLESEPYVKEKVWETITVETMNVVFANKVR